ncbi:bifunctional 4-hydroxy-2-oxoglutarate aldolase/2-dehydro-3-deoxy-phosphogluconate aldolase [Clostridium estertheticum]|uniref:bifunctional 4-hydroxy-2-oxoglutarate aldolase/2-dehydro-3-deoxy-phosphogluconate aldolase n=1 Tax=Clostridium estertheticum TaxID=238834 RepID=UPI001C7D7CB5|nr:bifunctional 4-hydroxy-2-oxoglutarate aldolase/2-dehydro-3-deoxy-phosphogluconate aldolase [Clostridium estertheticum]MBX4264523.1 bifunctional 4-hydroxy-2-oxoglutarate aldolase/2-dehydro-3-deoxy-phosphogluconate aldolase [Clostridium estertheticum]WLC88668.1 bifunctional 4-hydroxy-2-oxoglutarate aldolase/2-dehydro-3-deoxy-phosphogluconate aldolase [Clostridium estertheticum]
MNMKNFPKITIILRGYNYSKVRTVMNALSGSSIKAVEITMNTPGAVEMISKLSSEFEGKILIGAGTVTTLEKAKVAIKAGAKFILSPVMLSKEIIDLCKENSVISVPGTMSPTEIYKSYTDGADIIKVFPATSCGSEFFKGVKAPLGDLLLMAVGGVTKNNAKEFLDNGANFLGIGSGIFNKEDIESENLQGLIKSISEFEKIIG